MKINEILTPLNSKAIQDIPILGITNDSRAVQPGYLFIAYPGDASDGRQYINQAISNGASAIIYEPDDMGDSLFNNPMVECIAVPGVKHKLALLGDHFYQKPSKHLDIIGITGTNGKTTIAHLLTQAFLHTHQKAGYIGTLGQGLIHELKPLNNTTPDGLMMQQILHQFVKDGVKKVSMEVSSHALSLNRVEHIDINVAVYTNLSHEHLDFHHSMESYAKAKSKLFQFESLRTAIFNNDDAYVKQMKEHKTKHAKILTYGIHQPADVKVNHLDISMTGSQFQLTSPFGTFEINASLIGLFNIYNLLAIFCCLLEKGDIPATTIESVMSKIQSVPGRMEVVSKSPCVIVDYAHTPDALKNALVTLKKLKQKKLITIFGCGGDRDKEKRPMMGHVASRFSDHMIVTSDNPRRENPETIINDICIGIDNTKSFEKIIERKAAIERAINLADAEDIILIAGKGHESYQQIGDEKFDFSDQEVVKAFIKQKVPENQ